MVFLGHAGLHPGQVSGWLISGADGGVVGVLSGVVVSHAQAALQSAAAVVMRSDCSLLIGGQSWLQVGSLYFYLRHTHTHTPNAFLCAPFTGTAMC